MAVRLVSGDSLFLATANSGKVAELSQLLSPYGLRLRSAADADDYHPPVEDGNDFSANALIKARAAAKTYGMAALADDSGLCCVALGGRPGLQTARYGGDISYDDKACLLWEELADFSDKSASFVCAVACVAGGGEEGEAVFLGEVHGRIIYPAESAGGWGYDPYFIPDGHHCSFAALSAAEKNRISHRSLALGQFISAVLEV